MTTLACVCGGWIEALVIFSLIGAVLGLWLYLKRPKHALGLVAVTLLLFSGVSQADEAHQHGPECTHVSR